MRKKLSRLGLEITAVIALALGATAAVNGQSSDSRASQYVGATLTDHLHRRLIDATRVLPGSEIATSNFTQNSSSPS